ncbi:hypothetical protein [Szabonella alba]|uniref:Uncharacterized protein n=1 Tax=Szabonella alba TaxID=2804194 RepID=A0A8K0Y0R9_9RHOB|nr:hypothetical protein [Szabonella alba]MBL4917132.1 hypothetical protein [Szabonella alba]
MRARHPARPLFALPRLARGMLGRPVLALALMVQLWGGSLQAQTPQDIALTNLRTASLLATLTPDAELSDFARRASRHYFIWLNGDLPSLLPLALTLAEGGPEDRLLGLVIEARLLWSQGRASDDTSHAVARETFLRALNLAQGEAYTDRRIAGLLADLAAMEFSLGNTGPATAYLDRARACAGLTCAEDITSRSDGPAASRFYGLSRADLDDLARDFFARHMPGETAPLARHFASQGHDLGSSYPMEAATYLDRAWLTGRAPQHGLSAMDYALKANRFARLREIAAEMAERGLIDALPPRDALRWRRLDLRAAFRGGDPTAPAAYDALVDRAIADFLDPARFPDRYDLPAELDHLLRDIMDTDNLGAADRLSMAMIERVSDNSKWESLWMRRARLVHRDGQSLAAADILMELRAALERDPGSDPVSEVQEAAYARAGGDNARAEALLARHPTRSFVIPETGDPLPARGWTDPHVFGPALQTRDNGNHEAAAWLMADALRYVPTIAAEGHYTSAQWLWQAAFTLAIGGEPGAAFAVMSLAAAIAARLSFADPTGEARGSLQLLQRDNWRYLLFVDIAWAAAMGRPTEALLVVSDY